MFVAVTVWLCHENGLLFRPEAFAYRWSMRFARLGVQSPAPLLLIGLPPALSPEEESFILPRLLRILEQFGARAVVFNFLPANTDAEFYREAVHFGNVFFGRGLKPGVSEPGATILAELPSAAEGLPIQWGIVQLPPTVRGMARTQYGEFTVNDQHYPALERVVAQQQGAGTLPFAAETYIVDFREGPGSLPYVPAQRMLAGDIVAELVSGRVVLIGEKAEGLTPGVYTPTTGPSFMSVLEYQGHAFDTLLTGRTVSEVGRWTALLIFLCVAGGSLFVSEWQASRSLVWRVMTPFVVCVGLSVGALVILQLQLPIIGMLLVQLLTALCGFGHRAVMTNRALDTFVLLLSSALRDRLRLTAPTALDPWVQVVTMVQQTIDLKRMVFLDRFEGQYHVREVYAFNCSLADIDERRRDYRRTPYSTALETRAPIRFALTERPYLKNAEASEDQYLVPLIFNDHLYGFWAFGVDHTKAEETRDFLALVRAYSEQIGKLLWVRQQSEKEPSASGWRARLFPQHQREESYKALDRIVNQLEERLTQLETLLRDLHTATMVYDLLGSPLEVNLRMQELLRAEGITQQDLTIVELLAKLTHQDLESSRQALRNIVTKGHEISLPVTLSAGRNHYILNVRPLRLREGSELREGVTPFGVSGVVCELVDRTSLTRLYEIKTQVVDRLATQLRNDLATIELSSSLLGNGTLPEESRARVIDTIHEKVQQTVDLVSECQQYLSNDVYLKAVETFPVNVEHALNEVLETLHPSAEERGLRWEVVQPQLMSAVFASPAKIERVLSVILTVLIHDAVDRSAIRIEVVENEDGIVYTFANTGFGMPNTHFQEYLSGKAGFVGKELQGLREAMGWVKEWGGALEADNHVGRGIRTTLRLRRFV